MKPHTSFSGSPDPAAAGSRYLRVVKSGTAVSTLFIWNSALARLEPVRSYPSFALSSGWHRNRCRKWSNLTPHKEFGLPSIHAGPRTVSFSIPALIHRQSLQLDCRRLVTYSCLAWWLNWLLLGWPWWRDMVAKLYLGYSRTLSADISNWYMSVLRKNQKETLLYLRTDSQLR